MAYVRVGEVASRNLPMISADQSLAKAAEVMLSNKTLGVVTTDVKRRPMLVLSYRALVRAIARGASPQSRVSEHATDDVVAVQESASVLEVVEVMRREAVRFVPVVDARWRLVGVVEPLNVAEAIWDVIGYGEAVVEARTRGFVALPGDATIREAARAMDENGVPEILVSMDGEQRILREEDFLRAVAEERLDAKLSEYAEGKVIRIPASFDAKSAVELMLENGVRRLLVNLGERQAFTTLTDMVFLGAEILASRKPRETAFVLVKTEVGRELEVASEAIMIDGVTEAHLLFGEYDLLLKVEAAGLREIHEIVRDKIRKLRGVEETLTLTGVKVAAKQ